MAESSLANGEAAISEAKALVTTLDGKLRLICLIHFTTVVICLSTVTKQVVKGMRHT